MNKCIITGNIGKDLELRYTTAGMAVLDISVAVKRFGKDDKTDWFNVVAFGKIAENCANYLAKGSKILAIGSMQFETYDKQDGTKGYSSKLVAENIEFLDSKKTTAPSTFSSQLGEVETEFAPKGLDDTGYKALEDDDVPF